MSRDLVPMRPSQLLSLWRSPCPWYLYREKGGKPLPELHLRVTAEVPVEGTGWVTAEPLPAPSPAHPPAQPQHGGEGGPGSPLLPLVLLRLMHHCEAPAAKKNQRSCHLTLAKTCETEPRSLGRAKAEPRLPQAQHTKATAPLSLSSPQPWA